MSLPYRWNPLGAKMLHSANRRPDIGALWPHEHAVYRVIDIDDVPRELWTEREVAYLANYATDYQARIAPFRMVVRPVETPATGDVRDRDAELTVRIRPWHTSIWTYPNDHYPICATCHEPLPCRYQMAEEVAASSARRMTRYETPGVCPACEEPVTARQKTITFDDNLEVIGGPPLTFHLRGSCWGSAVAYEKRWVAQEPIERRTRLSCSGSITTHNDGTYECTEAVRCPGPTSTHTSHSTCRCPSCWATGSFDCRPRPNSVLRVAS